MLDIEPWLGLEPGRKGLIDVEDWAEIRRLHRAEGLSIKAILRTQTRDSPVRKPYDKFRSVDDVGTTLAVRILARHSHRAAAYAAAATLRPR